jgi:hypothetical protein
MGVLRPAIVGECVFQRLASVLRGDFSHLDGLVFGKVVPEKCFSLFKGLKFYFYLNFMILA